MKIVIFGATSKSGLEVIRQGVAAGHEIVAFVRDPAKLGPPAAGVTVVQGDASNAAQVEAALAGQEAAISLSARCWVARSPTRTRPVWRFCSPPCAAARRSSSRW